MFDVWGMSGAGINMCSWVVSIYRHNVSVPLITCHQHSHDCFIRVLSINMACWLVPLQCIVICHQHIHDCFIRMPSIHLDCSITVYCHNYVLNTVMIALLECHQYTLIVPLQYIVIICQSINPDCFWKPIKLLRTHPVDAEISDGSYRYLANYR